MGIIRYSSVAERLRSERHRLGFSLQEMAEKGGVGRTAQTTYEKGERSPNADYLQGITAHGVDGQYVLFGVRSLNMKDVVRSGMEDFMVEYEPVIRIKKGVDSDLLKEVISEVLQVIKWHSNLQKIEPVSIAEVVTMVYENYEHKGKRPTPGDESIEKILKLSLAV